MAGAVVAAIAEAAGASAATAATIGAVANVAFLVGGMAYSAQQQQTAKRKQRQTFNAQQVDRLANVVTTVGPRELVLGRVRKGGSIPFRGTVGQYKQKFIVHLTLAAHEIDGVEEIWFNDQKVTVDPITHEVQDAPYMRTKRESAMAWIPAGDTAIILPSAPEAGSVSAVIPGDGQASTIVPVNVIGSQVFIPAGILAPVLVAYQAVQRIPLATVHFDLGAPGSSADWTTKQWFPDLWTDAHRGEGIAKLIAVFDYDDSAYPNGVPNITVVMRGAKVYDPRDGVTRWTENPALLARHVYQHDNFGKATVSASEDARFIAAANACDVLHDYVVNGVTTTSRLFRAGTVVPYGTEASVVLDDLVQAMGGMWACGAELYIRAGTYTAPVDTFGDADLALLRRVKDQEETEQLSIAPHRERVEKFNVVNVRCWDSQQDYKQVALTPLKGDALITRDGEELPKDVEMPAVYLAPQALHVAGIMMRDARDALTIDVPLKLSALALEIFDTVQFAFSFCGWDTAPKDFLVLKRTWDRDKGIVRIVAKETSAAIFTPDAAFLPQGYASNTALPDPWDIEPPGTLTISSGTSELLIGADGTVVTRARVSWPAIADQRITSEGKVEVQWCDAATLAWHSIPVEGAVTETYITGLTDGTVILVRARTRTSLASSDWGGQLQHTVLGKTEAPAAPTGVTATQELVFFRLPTDLDLAGARIRSLPGMVAAPVFSRGIDVIQGLVRISPARMERRLYGVQTIMVVSEDTSGNQSEPAFTYLDFGQPDINSAVWNRAYAAESFPGTLTDCALSGGAVVADADPASDVYALADLYGEPDVYATLYKAMVWQSDVAIPPYAGTLALSSTIAGNAPAVEYRISGDTITDLYASSDVYALTDAYGAAGAWTQWPGALAVQRSTPLEFRVSIASSGEQGSIGAFTLSLILDVKTQTFSNVTLDAAGTRLAPSAGSPARNWIGSLRSIYGMPAVDGSGAIAGRVLDYSTTLGPLVQFVDNTGTAVTARGTVTVEGFSDE